MTIRKKSTKKPVVKKIVRPKQNNEKSEQVIIKELDGVLAQLKAVNADAKVFLNKTYREAIKMRVAHTKFQAQNNIEILKAIKKSLREEPIR